MTKKDKVTNKLENHDTLDKLVIEIKVEEEKEDEDKMIEKYEEHKSMKKLFVEIGQLHGINVTSTVGNDPKGDFKYPLEEEARLIEAVDKYLGHRKYKKGGEENNE